MNEITARRLNLAGLVITLATLFCAVIWAFPLDWGVVSSLKPEGPSGAALYRALA